MLVACASHLFAQAAVSVDQMIKPVQSVIDKYRADLTALKKSSEQFRQTLKLGDSKIASYLSTEELIDDELRSLLDGKSVDFKARADVPLHIINDLTQRRNAYQRELDSAKSKVFSTNPPMTAGQKAEITQAIDSITGKTATSATDSDPNNRPSTKLTIRRADGTRVVTFVSNTTTKRADINSVVEEASALGSELWAPADAKDVRELFQQINKTKALPRKRAWIGLLFDHARNAFTDRNGSLIADSEKIIKEYAPGIALGLKSNDIDKSRNLVVIARRSDGNLEFYLPPNGSGDSIVGYFIATRQTAK